MLPRFFENELQSLFDGVSEVSDEGGVGDSIGQGQKVPEFADKDVFVVVEAEAVLDFEKSQCIWDE
jgi:hypothetical protein